MKQKKFAGHRLLSVLCMAALLLTMASAAVVSTSLAKYIASGVGQATRVRIADFDVIYVNNDLGLPAGAPTQPVGCTKGGVIVHPDNSYNPNIIWTLENRSEVAVTVHNSANSPAGGPRPTGFRAIEVYVFNPADVTPSNANKIGVYAYTGTRAKLTSMTAGTLASPTQTAAPTFLSSPAYALPRGAAGNGSRLKFQAQIQGYGATAPGTVRVRQNVVGPYSIDFASTATPLWRTYRANADILITQVD